MSAATEKEIREETSCQEQQPRPIRADVQSRRTLVFITPHCQQTFIYTNQRAEHRPQFAAGSVVSTVLADFGCTDGVWSPGRPVEPLPL